MFWVSDCSGEMGFWERVCDWLRFSRGEDSWVGVAIGLVVGVSGAVKSEMERGEGENIPGRLELDGAEEVQKYQHIKVGLQDLWQVQEYLLEKNKAKALRKAFEESSMPDIAIGDRKSDFEFMNLCKERYIVPYDAGIWPVSQEQLPKPVIFHDGRLVQKPTPLMAFLIILWFPISIPVAILRVAVGSLCPMYLSYYLIQLLNCPIIVKGTPPIRPKNDSNKRKGVLFVCSHRTVLDAIFLSMALGRPVASPSYSVAKMTEFLSPIKSVRLTRDRKKDAKLIEKLLEEGDLTVCAEGTTCREPYLLRFSALFAELTDELVPVAISVRASLFHGTTARGYKWMDPFFYMMNPRPVYEITFLNKLTRDQTCSAGKPSHEVANTVQQMIASALSYKCTKFTRRDKYLALTGTDGIVGENKKIYS
ncbi:unnamed protein product [Fraxinus pennsylvanica]|uniref:Phospholipid/glycerol acyltransferase domain-containing protein n=1 Tax=Fraxinus pennsylvanica TaxID=56036 RepID=A0AAD2DHA1_9LAMI|nr:unnamed protein product [Fraxinus pennsylvanica]